MRKLAGLLLFLFAASASAQYILPSRVPVTYVGVPGTPPGAVQAGYTQITFQSTVFSTTNVDSVEDCYLNATNCSKQWFFYRLNNGRPDLGGNAAGTTSCIPNLIFPGDGSMQLNGCKTGPNGMMASGVPTSAHTSWHGTAFGGGMYTEVVMKFPSGSFSTSTGWPAWWAQPYETTLVTSNACYDTWGGSQSCTYHHNVENDFNEYINGNMGGSLHESYGVFNVTCTGFCQQNTNFATGSYTVPADVTIYHTYGMLWVPATATTSGYIQFWRDGTAMTRIYWPTQFNASIHNPPPPTIPASVSGQNAGNTWAFGAIDTWHYLLILGTGIGSAGVNPFPMYVQSVKVWQTNNANNLSQ